MSNSQKDDDKKILQKDTTSLIEERIDIYQNYDIQVLDLWESFQEDSQEFSLEVFGLAAKPVLQLLRKFLCKREVFVQKKARYARANALIGVTSEKEQREWTETIIKEYLSLDGPFISHKVNYIIKTKPYSAELRDDQKITPASQNLITNN